MFLEQIINRPNALQYFTAQMIRIHPRSNEKRCNLNFRVNLEFGWNGLDIVFTSLMHHEWYFYGMY